MRRIAAGAALTALTVACSASSSDDAGTAPTESPTTPTESTTASTTASTAPGAGVVYPGDEWERTDPETAGFDPAALDRLAAHAEAAGSSCLVVTRDGRVVDERYWGGADAEAARQSFSVTKSITSVLVGIARDEGLLDLEQPASDFVTEWQGTEAAAVTIENLLSNDSGRHWDFATDYRDMAIGAPDKTAFAIALGQDASPGEVWAYNNSAIQTLDAVLERATGEQPAAFAQQRLLDPIGMAHSRMTTDASGNTMTFMGLTTTCLDLARFGHLMLNDGAWRSEQIVSAGYVAAATGRSSTPLNAAYGYLFWLNQEGRIASPRIATGAADDPPPTGRLVPEAPDDVFWALGFNSQIVAVVPSEGIVAVRLGPAPPTETPFTHGDLTRGVLEAVAP